MNVKQVEIYQLKPALAERPFPVRPVVCRVTADNGAFGWGEAGIASGLGAGAVFHMLSELSSQLVGTDVMGGDGFFHRMNTSAYGHVSGGGAVFYSALSALDIALMDLKGKLLGVPVYQLLGGKRRDAVECYASQVHDGWRNLPRLASPSDFSAGARLVRDSGFSAAKFNFHAVDRSGAPLPLEVTANPACAGLIASLAQERMAAVRDAVGPDFILISESLNRLCPETAAAVDRVAHKYGVAYMEEYVFPYDPAVYQNMSSRFLTPMACGEKVFTRQGFLPYFRARSIGVAQPDVTMCGGLSEAKKICDMAEAFQIGVQPHLCGSPVAVAATLQLEASLGNFVLHEFLSNAYDEAVSAYCTRSFLPEGGSLSVPGLPGIGVELSRQAIDQAVLGTVIS